MALFFSLMDSSEESIPVFFDLLSKRIKSKNQDKSFRDTLFFGLIKTKSCQTFLRLNMYDIKINNEAGKGENVDMLEGPYLSRLKTMKSLWTFSNLCCN